MSYYCKYIGYFWIFCVLVIRSCVISPICGLPNYLWRNKTLKISIITSFWWRHQITSLKIRHQHEVTKIWDFQAPLPPFSKILVAPLVIIIAQSAWSEWTTSSFKLIFNNSFRNALYQLVINHNALRLQQAVSSEIKK